MLVMPFLLIHLLLLEHLMVIVLVLQALLISQGTGYQKCNIFTSELQSGRINFHLTLLAIVAIVFHQPFIVIC